MKFTRDYIYETLAGRKLFLPEKQLFDFARKNGYDGTLGDLLKKADAMALDRDIERVIMGRPPQKWYKKMENENGR